MVAERQRWQYICLMADNGFFNYDKELNDPLVCRNGFETWKRLTQRLRYSISIG